MKIKVKGILAAVTVCGAVLMVNQLTANAADQQVAPANLTASAAFASRQTSNRSHPAAPASQVALSTVNAISQPAATPITANSDTGNYGNLDGAAIVGNQVQLQGWNANGQAGNRPYHTIIVVDRTTGRELQRQTVQPVSRPDVQTAFRNVTNAVNSGWQVSFDLSDGNADAWLSHSLAIVSRYSNDPTANNTDANYWYAPITFDQQENGYLDSWRFASGHLTASGWHATSASYRQPYHWIIIYDQTLGREIKRVRVGDAARPDIAKYYDRTYGAAKAGWNLDYDFGTDSRYLNDQLQLISRYSDDQQGGEGHHTDYWYSPLKADQANRANLDNVTIAGGKLNLAGWHATDGSLGREHHFIILLDAQGHELGRLPVKNIARADVGRAFAGIYNSANSGWQVQFDLTSALVGSPLRIVSRYSSDPAGNRDYVDYWFNPVNFNHNQYAITSVAKQDGALVIKGYHAADAAYQQPNHYVIIYDLTAHQQVGSVKTPLTVTEPGVQLSAYNAADASFTAVFPQLSLNSGHQYALVLRYSANSQGNGDEGDRQNDTWITLSSANRGWLDSFQLSDGRLKVSGWHASDFELVAPYHFLIVYDNTAHQQVAAKLVTGNAARPDVQRSNAGIATATASGFNCDFGQLALHAGHSYSIVSRYSTISTGNGDNGSASHQDYWMPAMTLDQAHASIDGLTAAAGGIRVAGWLATDQLLDKPFAYVIGLYNGKEFGRQKISFSDRPDVARAYSQTYQSGHSGFDLVVPTNNTVFKQGQLSFILRVTDDPAGNGHASDLNSQSYAVNAGEVTGVYKPTTNTVAISGWHAAMGQSSRPYQYLIVTDLNGHEFYRRPLNETNSNLTTSAGARQAGWIAGAGNSAFALTLPVTEQMNHRGIRVIHRYTDDAAGNGDYIDWWSPEIDINTGFQSLNGGTVYYDPATGQLATGWRNVAGNNYYFADGYQMKRGSDDWVYNDQLHGQMYTGVQWADGHCYDFGRDGVAHAQPWNDGWSWPFPASGEGSFAFGQGFGYNWAGRTNSYHDGLDFGAYDHPGADVHAVHGGRVIDIATVRDQQARDLWWYALVWDGRTLFVYQEAFSNRSRIIVNVGDLVYPGQVIGYRDLSHLHLGMNTSPNYRMDLAHSYQPNWTDSSQATGSGSWIDPEWALRVRPY